MEKVDRGESEVGGLWRQRSTQQNATRKANPASARIVKGYNGIPPYKWADTRRICSQKGAVSVTKCCEVGAASNSDLLSGTFSEKRAS